jgi:lysophospholipase L1-like esterase
MRHSRFAWLLPVLAMAGCEPFDPWYDYAADDPNLQFIGRMDFTADPEKQGPIYTHSGGTIRFRCDCTGVDVAFEDLGEGGDEHTNWVNILVDGKEAAKVQLLPGRKVLLRGAHNLKPGEHTVEIVKRTEPYAGRIQFLGLSVQGLLLAPPDPPEKKMEVIGDSITCGYGNEVRIYAPNNSEPNTGYHTKNENISKAYGSLLARRFNAQLVTTCISGTGVYRNLNGTTDPTKTFPGLYGLIFPDDEKSKWDTSRYVPDLIVINLGNNDFNVIPEGETLPTAPDENGFKSAYKAFVRQLRVYYPHAKIVCSVGPMMNDNYPPGRKHWTKMHTWAEAMVTELQADGVPDVYYFQYEPIIGDPYGEDWHPTAESHQKMADEIAPFLESLGF